MSLILRFKKWWTSPSPEEGYRRGRQCARLEIIEADDESATADKLFNMADGAMNMSTYEREFDRGVCDQLTELGFTAPYTNGHF